MDDFLGTPVRAGGNGAWRPGGDPWPDGGPQSLRRGRRPDRRDGAHPRCALHRHRRHGDQRPVDDGPGPGRHQLRAAADPAPAPGRREPRQCPRRRRHPCEGPRGREHDAGRGRHAPAAAPASSPPARPGRRLPDPQPHRDRQYRGGSRHDPVAAAGCGRCHLPRGRWHRHHEHHAGERDRADPRDRPAACRRRAAARRHAPVPHRGDGARRHRRRGRHHRRAWGGARRLGPLRLASAGRAAIDRRRGAVLRPRRVFFGWYPARRASRLDPITALRTV